MACLMIGTSILVSCNDEMANVISPEEEIQNQIKPEYVTLSFNVSADEAASRTSYEESETTIIAKWSEDDYIYVGAPAAELTEAVSIDAYNSGFTKLENPTISDDGKTATFSGTVEVTTGSKIMAFYCKEPKMLEVTTSGVKMNFELAQSVSEINDLSQYDLMSATADYTNETESINLNFVHECAILKVNATGIEVEAGANVSKLEFTLPDGAGFYNAVTIGTDGNRTYGEIENTFSVQLNNAVATEGKLGAYCMVVTDGISAATNLGIKAIVDKLSGDYTYTSGLNVSSNIENGKFYYTPEIAMTLDNEIKTLEGFKLIDNVDKFKTIASDASSNYVLMRDLNFENKALTPISTFSGTFDGNGNTLSNITLNITDGNGGIFAENTGTIKNLNLTDVTVTKTGSFASSNPSVGILTASNKGTIENCSIKNSSITATISNAGGIGILSGENSSNIRYCKVTGSSIIEINGDSQCFAGGLVGKCTGGEIKFSYVDGADINHNITNMSGSAIGGLIGQCNISIEGCYAKASLYSNSSLATSLGGFIGTSFNKNDLNIKGCFSAGDIEITGTNNNISGFIGNFTGNGTRYISYCYTTVNTYNKGGSFILSSSTKAKCKNCYYTLNTGQTSASPISGTTNVDAQTLRGKSTEFNNGLIWSKYQFISNENDNLPLIIQKKQQ